jgi:hypothetical protein
VYGNSTGISQRDDNDNDTNGDRVYRGGDVRSAHVSESVLTRFYALRQAVLHALPAAPNVHKRLELLQALGTGVMLGVVSPRLCICSCERGLCMCVYMYICI